MNPNRIRQDPNNSKNLIVIGKTGAGKSYFLNMLIQEPKPGKGKFRVDDSTDSGTHECQVEINNEIQYGTQENNQTVSLNLIDTPGLFDTKDDPNIKYNNQNEPQSILNLKKIQNTVTKIPFQQQFNRVILVLSSDQKFDVQHQAMVDICKIMIGQQLKVIVAITKCSNHYDQENQEEIIEILNNLTNQWKTKLNQFQIEDIFFFSRLPLNKLQEKKDLVSQFFYDQWLNFFNHIQKSQKTRIKTWTSLTLQEQINIGKYFNYVIGKTEEDIEAEYKLKSKLIQMQIESLREKQRKEKIQIQLYYQQQEAEIEQQASKKMQQLKEERQQILNQQQDAFQKALEKQKEQCNIEIEKKVNKIKLKLDEECKKRQRQLERILAEQQEQAEQEEREERARLMRAGDGFCLSLDMKIDGINEKLGFDQLFNYKVNVQGFNNQNICLGLTHLSKIIKCNFFQFTFQIDQQQQNVIELSNVHLIYCTNKNQYIRAKDIEINDQLLYNNGQDQFTNVKIIAIQQTQKIGYYCPLTTTGEIFANGILVSCYISPYEFPVSQRLAQVFAKPLIFYRQLTMKYHKGDEKYEEQPQPIQYLAPFVKLVSKMFGVKL